MSASEQTSARKREPGYYWVRTQIDRFWIVRRFNSYGFWHDPHRNDVTDDEWSEIYEYRLPEPFAVGRSDELSKAQERNNRLELALADIATRARVGIIKKIAKEALSHD